MPNQSFFATLSDSRKFMFLLRTSSKKPKPFGLHRLPYSTRIRVLVEKTPISSAFERWFGAVLFLSLLRKMIHWPLY